MRLIYVLRWLHRPVIRNITTTVAITICATDFAFYLFLRQTVPAAFVLRSSSVGMIPRGDFISGAMLLFLTFVAVVMALCGAVDLASRLAINRVRCRAAARAETLFQALLNKALRETNADPAVFHLACVAADRYSAVTYDPRNITLPLMLETDSPDRRLPILSSNFGAYAHCVKTVMQSVPLMIRRREIRAARVYTFFERTIFEWYNPLVKIAIDKNGKRQLVAYSESWWEQYKASMASFKERDAREPILIIRLIAHPRRPSSVFDRAHEDVEIIAAATARDDYIIRTDIEAASPDTVQKQCSDIEGFRLISLISPDRMMYGADLAQARVHCIMKRERADVPIPHGWESMLNHFESAFHTGPYESGHTSGCFYAYTAKEVFPWGRFADVFVVELQYDDAPPGAGSRFFGIALQKDGFNDAEGIKILTPAESQKFKETFMSVVDAGDRGSEFSVTQEGAAWDAKLSV